MQFVAKAILASFLMNIVWVSAAHASCVPLPPTETKLAMRAVSEIEKLGATLDSIAEIPAGDGLVRLPIGYVFDRPSYYKAQCMLTKKCSDNPNNVHSNFGAFEFWMPDGAYAELSTRYLSLRRCEEGRANDEYVVRIEALWAFKDDSKNYFFAPRILKNIRIVEGKIEHAIPYKVFPKRPDGLIEYVRTKADIHDAQTRYIYVENKKLLSMSCHLSFGNKSCRGLYWDQDRDLAWVMWFPSERLDDWRIIIEMAEKKIDTWYQNRR